MRSNNTPKRKSLPSTLKKTTFKVFKSAAVDDMGITDGVQTTRRFTSATSDCCEVEDTVYMTPRTTSNTTLARGSSEEVLSITEIEQVNAQFQTSSSAPTLSQTKIMKLAGLKKNSASNSATTPSTSEDQTILKRRSLLLEDDRPLTERVKELFNDTKMMPSFVDQCNKEYTSENVTLFMRIQEARKLHLQSLKVNDSIEQMIKHDLNISSDMQKQLLKSMELFHNNLFVEYGKLLQQIEEVSLLNLRDTFIRYCGEGLQTSVSSNNLGAVNLVSRPKSESFVEPYSTSPKAASYSVSPPKSLSNLMKMENENAGLTNPLATIHGSTSSTLSTTTIVI